MGFTSAAQDPGDHTLARVTEVRGLYAHPELYEWAFSHRDISREIDAIVRWHARHGGTRSLTNALELGAGPAPHAIELARRGVAATALDRSATMRAFARRQARSAGVSVRMLGGDLRRFDLGARFDAVLCAGDSAAHLHDVDALVSHLTSVGLHLGAGGVYVMETAHPADFMGHVARTKRSWQVTRNGHRLRVRWGGPRDRFDPLTQLEHSTVTVTVNRRDGEPPTVVHDRLVLRRWTPGEIDGAARASRALRVVATYGGYDDEPLSSPSAARLITVLVAERETRGQRRRH
jgi:SAM-dependent methyltransferase